MSKESEPNSYQMMPMLRPNDEKTFLATEPNYYDGPITLKPLKLQAFNKGIG
jgi:hypothetical protein